MKSNVKLVTEPNSGMSDKERMGLMIDSYRFNGREEDRRYVRRGRIKQLKRYSLLKGEGSWRLNVEKFDVSGIKFSREPGKLTPEIKDKLPIPVNSNSKLIGQFMGTVPRYTGKIVYESELFVEFCKSNGVPIPGIKVTLPGDWKYNMANLVSMVSKPANKLSYKQLLNGLTTRMDIDLKLPRMDNIYSSSVRAVRVNKSAYSGLLTSRMFGNNMRKSTRFTVPLAKRVWDECITKNLIPDNSLWAVGGREKRIDLMGDIKQNRTRLILQCEDIPKIIGNAVLQPLTQSIKCMMSGSVMVGRSIEDQKYMELVDFIELDSDPSFGVADCDWSQFDNHVYEELMVTAFGVLYSLFPDDEMLNYFIWNCGSMLCKNVVLPESKLIYRITKGLASGHPYTSLIGTIINWLVWSAGLASVCTPDEIKGTRLLCMGDDTLIRLPNRCASSLQDFIMVNSGMKVDPFLHRVGPFRSQSIGGSKTFLKKHFTNILPQWDFNSIFDNLLYPPRHIGISKEIERVKMLMYTAPFHGDSFDLLDAYSKWLISKFVGDTYDDKDIRNYVFDTRMKGWRVSVSVARRWFVSVRNWGSIGIRYDDWDTKTDYVYGISNTIPTYFIDYALGITSPA